MQQPTFLFCNFLQKWLAKNRFIGNRGEDDSKLIKAGSNDNISTETETGETDVSPLSGEDSSDASDDEEITAVFTLYEKYYTVNGERREMDAEVYLDENNRTMVPIRYASLAYGVDESGISWDQASQTATITGSDNVVKLTVGSNVIETEKGSVTMDTVVVNNDGRIYVPVRYMALALGFDVAWDQTTKTATFTNY